ncbi:MAG: alpha-mannosidase [Microbacteriaceae bacterium]|nr:alpha-mannosidase [Microbacteriaceae bacterium]
MSSPRRYFDEVLARGDGFLDSLDVLKDDLQHHAPGCYSAHSGIKAWQKRAQYAVLSAERWAAVIATQSGTSYPREDLERAWKQVLFNQFHDVLPGSAIESAYTDARDQLGEAVSISKRIIVRAHNVIARQIDVPFEDGTQPVVVFNQHPWPVSTDVALQFGAQRAGVHVVDDEGRQVLFQKSQSTATTDDASRGTIAFRAEIPAFGYRLYRLRPGAAPRDAEWTSAPPSALSVTSSVIENEFLRLEIDPKTGWFTSFFDKVAGVDVMAGVDGSTHTQVCDDPTDTWGHRVVSYAWPGDTMKTKRIVVRESGPLRSRVRVEREWGNSTLVEEFVLSHDSAVLRVDVTLDWREKAHLLKLRFPTVLEKPRARYEIPFGSMERPVDGAEEPAQSWVDVSGTVDGSPAGLTVVTTNKHAFDVSPGEQPSIGITAVRSPVYSWHDPRLLDPAGIYTFQDQGVQEFSYELVLHAGDWTASQPTRRASVLGSPVRAMLESSHGGLLPRRHSFASDGAGSVAITAIKGTEDVVSAALGGADLIVRAAELHGTAATVELELPLVGRTLALEFGPSQVRTFRVPLDPTGDIVEVDLVERPLAANS